MKTKHRVLSFLSAIAIVFTLCFSAVIGAGCQPEDPSQPEVTKTLESITLDTENVKTQYFVGEEFTKAGLKVTANYSLSDGSSDTADVSDKATVNSSAFKNDAEGNYTIKVGYSESLNGSTKSVETEYSVSVVARRNGLALVFKEGKGAPVNLSTSQKSVDMSDVANWIEVKQPNESGEIDEGSDTLPQDLYTVKVYKEKEEITDLSAVKRGTYQIWASRYDEDDDFTYEGFILFYVVDTVDKIERTGGDITQERSLKETMTSTWKFTVTYHSGETIVVDKTNRYLVIPTVNANADQSEGRVVVEYNEPLPNGTAQSKTVTVRYTLTGTKAVPDMAILNTGLLDDVSGVYETEFLDFTLIGISGKSTLADNRGSIISLPTGLEVNGNDRVSVAKAWQSGGTSSISDGGYISFISKRNFTVYLYAHSNGTVENERYIDFETTDDYVRSENVDGCKAFGENDCVGVRNSVSVHAQHVTEVSADGVTFTFSFSASINLLYILVVFD
ncbi:MAG: hypothetical protein K2K80_02600 [Clostridia bacterium]|nr:hypothetical protein [Clostridia bacterium]